MIDDMMDKELDVMREFLGPIPLLEEIKELESDIMFSEKSIAEMKLLPPNNGDMSLGFAIVNLEATKRRLDRLKKLN